jgi:ATP-binding cassette subfamily B protein
MNRQIQTTQQSPAAAGPGGSRPGFGGGPGSRFTPGEKAKDARGTFRKLLQFYFKEAKSLFVVIALLLADTVIIVFAPYWIGRALDALDDGVDFSLVYM